jgi:hypothetical protein
MAMVQIEASGPMADDEENQCPQQCWPRLRTDAPASIVHGGS